MSNQNYNYVNKNGKKVRGAAAVLHHIYKVCDGVDDFVKKEAPKCNRNHIDSFVFWIPKMISKCLKKVK